MRLHRTALVAAWTLVGLFGCHGQNDAALATREEPTTPTRELPPMCVEAPPPATPTRLLTRTEYDHTVRDLLGDLSRPAQAFPVEPRVLGFENNVSAHRVNPLLIASYLDAAETIAQDTLTLRRERVVPCDPAVMGEVACADAFLDALLPRAFRRPPTAEERTSLQAFLHKTLADEGFDTAVEWTLQVVLQSPQFLYRIEQGTPGDEGVFRLGPYEIASRLSYFLWSSMPDDALLEAARTGRLDTVDGIEAEARRMIADPKAVDTLQSFVRQWLHLDGIEKLEKNVDVHPVFTPPLAQAWRTGLELYIGEAFWGGAATLRSLLTSPAVYMNETSGPVYGMTMAGEGFLRMDMPATERAGLLTQPGLLAALAGSRDSSPVLRGVFVREKFLCETLPPPPDDAAITPPDPDPNATTRERFAEHTANDACAGCHRLIDPLGFGLEQYDALGRFRTSENGLAIDATGHIANARDSALEGSFNGATELAAKLAGSTRVHECVATQWFRYAMGRLEVPGDGCTLRAVQDRFLATDGDFRELLVAITRSPAFRLRVAPQEAP